MTATNPIQPVATPETKPAASAATTTGSAPATQSAVAAIAQEAAKRPAENAPQARNVDVKTGGTSPIKAQRVDPRFQDKPVPVQIIFQEGKYAGKSLDLGTAVLEIDTSQRSYWEQGQEHNIRQGLVYTATEPRNFTLQLEFADVEHSVIFLSEQVSLVNQVDPDLKRPPLLILVLGDQRIPDVCCTSYKCKLSEPYAGGKGFRRAEVDLDLEMSGGANSPQASAKPLTPTPLGDEAATKTETERQRQGTQQVAQILLADCLSEKANQQLSEMISNGQQTSIPAAMAMADDALVQGAIAGLFAQSVLDDSGVQQKVHEAVASVMAANEDGVGRSSHARQFANALMTGTLSGLPTDLQTLAQRRAPHYDAIVEAILKQDLGKESALFSSGSPAADLLRSGFGACGLSLRRTGAVQAADKGEAETLKSINDFLGDSKTTTEQIKARFGTDDAQTKLLQNVGGTFESRSQFVEYVRKYTHGNGYAGEVLWSNFVKNAPTEDSTDPEKAAEKTSSPS